MDIGLVSAAGLLGLALLALEARRRERATRREWDLQLTPKGERTCDEIERRVRDHAQLVDLALKRTAELQRAGACQHSRRVLDSGRRLLGHFVADMLALLAGMARFSRLASALAGVPALPARPFRTPPLAWRAQLCTLAQPFMVTAGERFRLRIATLRSGFALLRGVVEAAGPHVSRAGSAADPVDWPALEAARLDLATLTDESLLSLRLLLGALAAQPRAKGRVVTEGSRP